MILHKCTLTKAYTLKYFKHMLNYFNGRHRPEMFRFESSLFVLPFDKDGKDYHHFEIYQTLGISS